MTGKTPEEKHRETKEWKMFAVYKSKEHALKWANIRDAQCEKAKYINSNTLSEVMINSKV